MFICGHYVRTYQDFLFNPVLPALKYGQAMEMETANVFLFFFFFFELMKNKHIKLVISECAFLAKQIVLLEQGLTA